MDKQMSLVEALLHPKLGANTKLDGMHGQVDWAPIGQLAEKVRLPAATGRKPYVALPMLKILYLQAAYNLGDKETEEALVDRFSFRRFCGFISCTGNASSRERKASSAPRTRCP